MSESGVNRTLLHVDDDPDFTRLVQHLLAPRGYSVVSLNDPQQAENELTLGGYRMVLLDIDMPGLDGLELLRRIKAYDGGIQVIVLTGIVTLGAAMAASRRGAEACFFKPLGDVDALCESIDTVTRKIEHWWRALHQLSKQRRVQDLHTQR